MTKRCFIITLCALFLALPSFVSAGEEHADGGFSVEAIRLRDRVGERLSGGSEWAVAASDLGTGRSLLESGKRDNAAFAPGSLVKLLVAGAILEQNSRRTMDLETIILASGDVSGETVHGDVVLQGAGNALLSSKDLLAGIEKMKSAGIKKVAGDIVVDDQLFEVKGWSGRFSGPAYAVPSALGLDLHTVSITSDGSGRFVAEPPNDAVKVRFNPSGKRGIRQIDDLSYEVTGAVRDAPAVRNRFSLADPAMYAGGTFLTLLKRQGIEVAGSVKRSPSPLPVPATGAGGKVLARIGSRSINELVRDTNQQSLNVSADNLLFLLGAEVYGAPGTREKGIRAVNRFLSELQVPPDGLIVDDGSGISELNRISADQMVVFLEAVAKKSWFPDFFDSLSRPGIDGRLRDFGYKSERIRAKSGQLRDAYCLAGYVDRLDGRKIAFAYMVNGTNMVTPEASSAAVEVLRQLEGK